MTKIIGGGGPFNVMDLTKGNLLNIHCLELMRDAETGGRTLDELGRLRWITSPGLYNTRLRYHAISKVTRAMPFGQRSLLGLQFARSGCLRPAGLFWWLVELETLYPN